MNFFEIRWMNFRCFDDTGWLILKPITIVIGPNNSGKTSVLAPLLLLKQSIKSRDRSLALKTRGSQINLGDFEDMVRDHKRSSVVRFCIRIPSEASTKGKPSPIGEEPPTLCELSFASNVNSNEAVLQRYYVEDRAGRTLLERIRKKNGSYSLRTFSIILRSRSVDLREIRRSKPVRFLFSAANIIRALIGVGTKTKGKSAKISIPLGPSLYVRIVEWVDRQIHLLLTNISYVGPLREHPKRTYYLSGETPESVGTRGQYAAEIILRDRRKQFKKNVNKWIQEFGFGSGIKCIPISKSTFELRLIREKSTEVNFADTGFGISQVLPLIVEGFYAKKGSLIIAEQPEIHLNPSLQGKLADLFSAIAKNGSRVLLETHSEHLILRLRRLISDGTLSTNDVALYYVGKQGMKSSVRKIEIQPTGHIDTKDWPAGFFEDSLREALGLAISQSRSTKHA